MEQRPLPTLTGTFLAMLCGLCVIYTCGMLQLSLVLDITLKAAFMAGVFPFIGIAIIKIALGAAVACSVRTILIKQNLLNISGS